MAFNFFQKFIGRRAQKQDSRVKKTGDLLRRVAKPTAHQEPKNSSAHVDEGGNTDGFVATKGRSDYATTVALLPHISEKATKSPYVFRVSDRANKATVKKAIEGRYNVKVSRVRIINTHGRVRRRGNITGFQPAYKKVLVTLQKNYSIEEM